jgi:hypothetical protein
MPTKSLSGEGTKSGVISDHPAASSWVEREARRHHAENRARALIEIDGLTDDPRIRSERAAPERVGEHD